MGTRTAALTACLAAAVTLAALPSAASAANPWLSMRVLNQAHQGGEDVNPSNTMYAYAEALAAGSDMLELDVHSTADRQLVVIHDEKVDRTTNGTGTVKDMTLAQVQALDAAHWFVPDRGTVHGLDASAYPLRGVRDGLRPAPPGYDLLDFRIPTLAEVLNAYPHIPINIEIKGGDNTEKFAVADDLAAMLRDRPDPQRFIVASFEQAAVDRFHAAAPAIPTAPGIVGVAQFLLLGLPAPPGTAALQIPYTLRTDSIGLDLGLPIEIPLAAEWVTARAHAAGIAVQYWQVPENDAAYQQVLAVCGDGVMTTRPDRYEDFLRRFGAPRLGGQGGADSCGNAPPPPPPGCRLHFAKILAPDPGTLVARFERWGDLRGDCRASLTLTSVKKYRPLLTKKQRRKIRRARGAKRRKLAKRLRRPAHLALGAGSFTAPAGRSGTSATIRLSEPARRALKRYPGITADLRLSGTATDASRVVFPH